MNKNKTSNGISDISLSNAAIIAGIGLLLMAIVAPIANFSILGGLIVPDEASETVSNISGSTGLFRLGIFIFLIVAVLDIIVAWALYVFLKPVNRSLSLLTAWFRLVYAALLVFVLIFLINVLHLVSGAGYLKALETNQLQTLVMLSVNNFILGWEFGLIIFGFHLSLLGYLMLKAGYMLSLIHI